MNYEKQIRKIIERGGYAGRSSNPTAMLERFAGEVIELLGNQEPVASITKEQRRLITIIAEKIEDGTLFNAGIYSRKELSDAVRKMLVATPPTPVRLTDEEIWQALFQAESDRGCLDTKGSTTLGIAYTVMDALERKRGGM